MAKSKMHIKKNDLVVVITGADKGKRGRVLKVFPARQRVIVEGVNFIKRHTKPTQKNPQGGIIEKEAPIHVSNVMLISPGHDAPTRVSTKLLEGDDKLSRRRVRYSKKFDEIIPSGE